MKLILVQELWNHFLQQAAYHRKERLGRKVVDSTPCYGVAFLHYTYAARFDYRCLVKPKQAVKEKMSFQSTFETFEIEQRQHVGDCLRSG